MKLIIGLGNPGKKFARTRHNVGHLFISNIKNQISKLHIKNEKLKIKNQIKLRKTTVFMNGSGKEVKKLVHDSRLATHDLLIVHDDMDLPLGEFKLQRGRGAAGHKGVQSVIDALGTRDFWRLRFGIDRLFAEKDLPRNPTACLPARQGKPQGFLRQPLGLRGREGNAEADYVLSKFSQEELNRLRDAFKEAYPRVLEWTR